MEEQTTTATEQPAKNIGDGNIPETTSLLDQADRTAKRMEEATKKFEELVKRNEAINARMMLAGRSQAGQPTKTAEELQAEKDEKEIADLMKRKGYR